MTINQLTVFAQNGEKNTTGLTQVDGFPSTQKPARQWFNSLFYAITTKINELVNAQNELVNAQNGQLSILYPVGIVVEFSINTNPNTIWPNTTWVRFAEGKTTVGYQSGDPDFGAIGQTGGKKGHKMTIDNLIEHQVKLPISDEQDPAPIATYGEIGGQPNAEVENFTSSVMSTRRHLSAPVGSEDPDPIPTLSPYVVTAKWTRTA